MSVYGVRLRGSMWLRRLTAIGWYVMQLRTVIALVVLSSVTGFGLAKDLGVFQLKHVSVNFDNEKWVGNKLNIGSSDKTGAALITKDPMRAVLGAKKDRLRRNACYRLRRARSRLLDLHVVGIPRYGDRIRCGLQDSVADYQSEALATLFDAEYTGTL